MTRRGSKRDFVSRPRDPDTWIRAPERTVSKNGAKADQFTARLTVDVTPELRGRIKVAAFRRGVTRRRIAPRPARPRVPPPSRRQRMSELTHVELVWIKKRIENRIRFGRIAEQHVIDRQRRVVSFAAGSIFAFVALDRERLRNRRIAHRHPACGRAGRALRDGAVCASRRREFCCAFPGGRRSRRCCRRSTPSRRSASIRPMPRRTTGSTSTIACPSASSRDPTRRAGIRPGCIGGD